MRMRGVGGREGKRGVGEDEGRGMLVAVGGLRVKGDEKGGVGVMVRVRGVLVRMKDEGSWWR